METYENLAYLTIIYSLKELTHIPLELSEIHIFYVYVYNLALIEYIYRLS